MHFIMHGNLKADFEMNVFSEPSRHWAKVNDCGSVGCSIGHGPYSLGIKKEKLETWRAYSKRVFGLDAETLKSTAVCFWLFSGNWKKIDNTPLGAGKRILYFLEHGLPCDYYLQIRGKAPLCYK